ncbi:MAG: hypothetical protein ABI536_06630, partial [Gallionella sp.]
MERKIYWGVAALIGIITIANFFIPSPDKDENLFPWHIEHPTANSTRVFGVTLNENTLNEAEQSFKQDAQVSMFKSRQGKLSTEAYFDEVIFNGLKATIVVTLAVPDTEMQAMLNRSVRAQGVGSGKQITLTPEDVAQVRRLPVSSLTYMPSVHLEEAVFTQRFGIPTQRIKEADSGVIHWLYAQHGLDITFDGAAKPLLQYVAPSDFAKLTAPLIATGKVID